VADRLAARQRPADRPRRQPARAPGPRDPLDPRPPQRNAARRGARSARDDELVLVPASVPRGRLNETHSVPEGDPPARSMGSHPRRAGRRRRRRLRCRLRQLGGYLTGVGSSLRGDGVDAVGVAAGRAVGEDVAQMPATSGAGHLGATHEQAAVLVQLDVRALCRVGKARPAGARVELGVRGEEPVGAPTVHPSGPRTFSADEGLGPPMSSLAPACCSPAGEPGQLAEDGKR